MTHTNPHYVANWQELRNKHGMEMRKADNDTNVCTKAGDIYSDAYKEAKARQEHHLKSYQETFRQEFPTVQGYAAWLFRSFDPTMPMIGNPIPLPSIDLDVFQTIEEAHKEWSRISKIVRAAEIDAAGAMKVGQPPGLLAFADSSRAVSYWRQFTGEDLYPEGYVRDDFYVSALVTVDELDDGWHFCFMQDPAHPSPSVVNEFEHLATVIFREAKQLAEQGQSTGLLSRIGGLLRPKPISRVIPERFHFYEHCPSAAGGGVVGESFARIGLRFDGKTFRDPEWRSPEYKTIPAALRNAPVSCAKGGSVGGPPLLAPPVP